MSYGPGVHVGENPFQDTPENESRPSSVAPDLISDLLDTIDRYPPAIDARVVLMQQWIKLGLLDFAENVAKELLQIDPSNTEAQMFLSSRQESMGSNTKSGRSKNDYRKPPKLTP